MKKTDPDKLSYKYQPNKERIYYYFTLKSSFSLKRIEQRNMNMIHCVTVSRPFKNAKTALLRF